LYNVDDVVIAWIKISQYSQIILYHQVYSNHGRIGNGSKATTTIDHLTF